MMTRIIAIGLFLFSLKTYTQNYRFQHPKTPEVYMLDKYGNPDISLYTGRPNISIPLFNVKNGDIDLPFRISYNSNGIRGDEEASQVGLGWNFENPILTQIINGADDLNVPIVRTKYYHKYKASYLVYPQPYYFYNNYNADPMSNTRISESNLLISDPTQHLYDGFIGKLKSEGKLSWGYTQGMTYIPINNQLSPYHFLYEGISPSHKIDFDMEMDFFRANFFGHNIIFYKIPNQNQFFVLNKKGYKVILNNPIGPIYNWEITTPDGTKFTFSNQKISGYNDMSQQNQVLTEYLNTNLSHRLPTYNIGNVVQPPNSLTWLLSNRTWNVTGIHDKNNNFVGIEYQMLQVISSSNDFIGGNCNFLYTFNTGVINPYYTPQYEKLSNLTEPGQIEHNNGNYIKCNRSISNLNYENSIIKRIFYNDSEIIFSSSLRHDNPYDARIDLITIKNSNIPIKTIIFNYNYYPEAHVLSKRLRLDSIKIGDQSYGFQYNNNTLQHKTTDYWGNFNGLENKTPFTNPFRFYQNSSEIPSWANGLYQMTLNTENKSAHPENSKIGILEKIFYPTGGYTKYEYELNTFENYFFPNYDNKITVKKNSFNLHHLNIDANLEQRSSPSFNVVLGDKIEGVINISNGISGTCPYQSSSFKIVKIPPDWIGEYNSGTTGRENFWYVVDQGYVPAEIVYQMTNFTNLNDINFSINIDTDATLAARVKYSPQCPTIGSPIGQINVNFSTTKYNDYLQNFSVGNGLRVKSTSDYTSNNQLISKKNYNYFGGKHISPISKINNEEYNYTQNHIIKNQGQAYYRRTFQESHKVSSFNTSLLQTNVLGNGDGVGYEKVEITEVGLNNDLKGKVSYTFSNVPDLKPTSIFGITDDISENDMNMFGRGVRNSDLDNGSLLTKKVYDKNNTLIKSLINEYYTPLNLDSPTCYNIAVRNGEVEGAAIDAYSVNVFNNTYLYYYPLKGSETLLSKSIEVDYFANNSIKTITNFSYNGQYNLPNQKIISLPTGEEIKESIYYSNSINHLKNNNILSRVIGKSVYKNNQPQPWNVVKFDNVTHFNPTSEVLYEINSPNINPQIQVTYDRYDSKGNLEQYTTKEGISTTIIWGYNQTQPIAKIEGAIYSDVQNLISSIVTASNTDAAAIPGNDETTFLAELDLFRKNLALSNYQITTYTYDPLIGVRSITPPSGIREVYFYDTANRLEKIVDINGKILKEFKYNYKH